MVILIMGVAGVGKTTVGKLLATQLDWTFVDGDSFHPPENIRKMSQGIPLTDEDRAPWLAAMRDSIRGWLQARQNVVLAASALKQAYRDALLISPEVKLVYLHGSAELIRARLLHRHHHFAHANLLSSQLEDLEEPKNAIVVDASHSPNQIVSAIRSQLSL